MARHSISLRCMTGIGSRVGSPGEILLEHRFPVDEEHRDILFVFRDGMASFEPMDNEDNTLKPEGTQAWFFCHGPRLMVEPYASHVTIESPPSSKLPLDPDFSRLPIPANSSKDSVQRQIFLRPDDTVIFEDQACAIRVDVVDSESAHLVNKRSEQSPTPAAEVQVKSSAQDSIDATTGAMPRGVPAHEDDETDDDDDLDGPINTPGDGEGVTPATSNPTGGPPVKETPTRPVSRDSNVLFSTAPDTRNDAIQVDGTDDIDNSTPAARAGKLQGTRKPRPTSADSESQIVFGDTTKGQNKYGSAKKRNRRVPTDDEVLESPQNVDGDRSDQQLGESPTRIKSDIDSKPCKRKSSPDAEEDEDDEGDKDAASTLPPRKKPRGRPRKSGTQPAHSTKEEEDGRGDGPPSSSGHLRKPGKKTKQIKTHLVKDESDGAVVVIPRQNETPASSATPPRGKPPAKIIFRGSKHADNKKVSNWLGKQGVSVVGEIPGKRSNFACVLGKGPLSTTSKVLRSLVLGKRVVTDQWLEDSMAQDQLLDLEEYVHDDLAETIGVNRSKLFAGKTLFFTNKLKSSYTDLSSVEQLASEAGALRVEHGSASKGSGKSASSTIFLGHEGNDPDALALVQENGLTVYKKDLLTQSIIRGELLCDDDEFVWKPNAGRG